MIYPLQTVSHTMLVLKVDLYTADREGSLKNKIKNLLVEQQNPTLPSHQVPKSHTSYFINHLHHKPTFLV